MFEKVRRLELAIVFTAILLGGMAAHRLGYAVQFGSAWDAIVFLLLAPLLEEYVFRFLLQQWIADRLRNPRFALITCSIIFAMCHMPWIGWAAVGMLIPGLMLGFYWMRFRKLWWNVALHSVMNAALWLVTMLLN